MRLADQSQTDPNRDRAIETSHVSAAGLALTQVRPTRIATERLKLDTAGNPPGLRLVRPTRIATERLKPEPYQPPSSRRGVRPTRIATERLKPFLILHAPADSHLVRPTRIATERLKPAHCWCSRASCCCQTDPNRDRAIETREADGPRPKTPSQTDPNRDRAIETSGIAGPTTDTAWRQTDPNRDRAIETSSINCVQRQPGSQTDPNRDRAIETMMASNGLCSLSSVRPTRIATERLKHGILPARQNDLLSDRPESRPSD